MVTGWKSSHLDIDRVDIIIFIQMGLIEGIMILIGNIKTDSNGVPLKD